MTLRGPSEMTAEGRYFASLYNNTVVCLSNSPATKTHLIELDIE